MLGSIAVLGDCSAWGAGALFVALGQKPQSNHVNKRARFEEEIQPVCRHCSTVHVRGHRDPVDITSACRLKLVQITEAWWRPWVSEKVYGRRIGIFTARPASALQPVLHLVGVGLTGMPLPCTSLDIKYTEKVVPARLSMAFNDMIHSR